MSVQSKLSPGTVDEYQVDRLALVLMYINFATAIQRMQLLHFGKSNKDNNKSQQYKQSDNEIQTPDKT